MLESKCTCFNSKAFLEQSAVLFTFVSDYVYLLISLAMMTQELNINVITAQVITFPHMAYG